MIRVTCFRCKTELDEPGSILLSPADLDGHAVKKHFCVRCHKLLFVAVGYRGCCERRSGGLLLSPPDKDDRVHVTKFCASHYLAALKSVDTSLRGTR